jgi:hypothetical protein
MNGLTATDAITAPTFYTEIVDLHRCVIGILDRGADIVSDDNPIEWTPHTPTRSRRQETA